MVNSDTSETTKTAGCIHAHIKNGQIQNIFSHLSGLPDEGVIHLKPDAVLSHEEFKETHTMDIDELKAEPEGKIYELGDDSYRHKEQAKEVWEVDKNETK